MPHDPEHDPLHRLSEAVAAFLDGETKHLGKDEVLAQNEDLRDLLEPMFARRDAEDAAIEDGTKYLGDYRLIREIGRGGMGVVYEAEEVALGRRVALKVMPPTLTKGPRQIERFRREAAAAARLEHPGIVPIFSVGEFEGSHFFAMELVHGPSLHAALSEVRKEREDFADGFGRESLRGGFEGSYLAQCLEIVAQSAEAIAAAHAGGVIHRDIKPQNILFTGEGQVRVVDFGLAKDLDRATISQSREVAGTPHYMSPEQVRGLRDVDERSDVYSLGVVLYELLTLRCPFESDSTQALMLDITLQEARALRKLNPRAPREVEIICHKAMEKDPDHRYQTAAELAADVRRFLNHEPIVAQPPSTFSRIVKLVRRRRAAAVAVGLAVLIPVIALVGYYVVYRPTSAALANQRSETAKVRKEGDATYGEAHRMLQSYLDRAVELSRKPGMAETSRDMMKEAVATLERLENHKDRFPQQRDLLAQGYLQMGAARFRLGENEHAMKNFDRGCDLLDGLRREDPENRRYRALWAEAVAWRGTLRSEYGRTLDAERDQRTAIAIFEDDLATKTHATSEAATRKALVTCYVVLGASIFSDTSRLDEAIAAFEKSLRLYDALPAKWQIQKGVLDERSEALRSLGKIHAIRGDWKRAEATLLEAKKACDAALLGSGDALSNRRVMAMIHRDIARVCKNLKREDEAERHFTQSIDILRAIMKDYPSLVPAQHTLARALRDRGLLMAKRGQTKESRELLQEAVDLIEEIPTRHVTIYRASLASIYAALAQVRGLKMQRAEVPAVEALFVKAAELQAELVKEKPGDAGPKHELATTLQHLATLQLALFRLDDARETLRRAVHEQEAALALHGKNPSYRDLLTLHHLSLVEVELAAKDHTAATEAARNAAKLKSRNPRHVYTTANHLARCAAMAAQDAALIPLERDELVDELVRESLTELKKAIAGGAPLRMVRANRAFSVLHERDEWKKMVGDK